jgi:hypothetical protein
MGSGLCSPPLKLAEVRDGTIGTLVISRPARVSTGNVSASTGEALQTLAVHERSGPHR